MASEPEPPLLVICGPTASGKSALAMKAALKFDGEIICADSRTVYKGMDIGTAKPSQADQALIRHHLLDVVDPDQVFSAFDFQRLARVAIQDIRLRGKMPIMVGGTGLYIDSVVFDYQFPLVSKYEKEKFEKMSLRELYIYCSKNNISLPENEKNKRYLVNSILRGNHILQRRNKPINNTTIVAITTKREKLKQNIIQRTEHLFKNGVVKEAKKVGEIYGWECEATTGNIYRLAKKVLDKEISIDEAKEKVIVLDWRLAKRQLTWLKRNSFIHWGDPKDLYQYISSHLNVS